MKTVKKIARVVFPLLSVLMIIFIFYQSSMNADDSSVESGSLMEMINGFLKALGIPPFISDHLIRKAAHFSEYFILGTLLFASMKVWLDKDILVLTYPAAAGLLVAVSDEFIQTFSEGRSGEVKDVLLDLAGVLTAIVALYLLLRLFIDIRKNKQKEEDALEDGNPPEKESDAADEKGEQPDETIDEDNAAKAQADAAETTEIQEKRETRIE